MLIKNFLLRRVNPIRSNQYYLCAMETKYTAPTLTVVTLHVEHGYAFSPKAGTTDVLMPKRDDLSESRKVSTNWAKDNDDAFWDSDGF